MLLKDNTIYKYNEISKVLKKVRPYFRFAYKNKTLKYFNVPCAFDIETSSFTYETNGETQYGAIMYEWTFGIFGVIIIGRTWDEFVYLLNDLSRQLDLNNNKRLIIFCHNLNFEFQFIRLHLQWKKIFAIDNRKPVYAITTNGFEFRCSYILSGYSLESLAKNIKSFNLNKKVGYLDYNKIRHSMTPLTEKEIEYCVYDVKIVLAYIFEEIENNKNIAFIPLTKTGYVRRYVKSKCFSNKNYRQYIKKLRLDVEEYKQLKRAFQGGFTHCNPFYADKIVENVASFDFTSSYPAVMLTEQFPSSNAELISIKSMKEFRENLKLYCCLFDIEFFGLRSKNLNESYISISRSNDVEKPVINNGRIVQAEHLTTTITEQDFKIISYQYEWDKIRVYNFRRYRKEYLPKEFIEAILKLYEDKTKLKGVEGEEVNYLRSKEMLNSCYGMTVTDIVRNDFIYDNNEWETENDDKPLDYKTQIEKYNNNFGRFLFFPWGIWVTAYSRYNLWTAIKEFNTDYIYSDTDSVKVKNSEKHMKYIEAYNQHIIKKAYKTMDFYGIPREQIAPETIKGKQKYIGVWDYEGHYKRFKTLGAKRYMIENDKGISITVSGLNKKTAVPFICNKWYYEIKNKKRIEHNSPFDRFSNNLYVPADYTGKMTHRYIDDVMEGNITDYTGTTYHYKELSGIHLENADYSLSLSRQYVDYILSLL